MQRVAVDDHHADFERDRGLFYVKKNFFKIDPGGRRCSNSDFCEYHKGGCHDPPVSLFQAGFNRGHVAHDNGFAYFCNRPGNIVSIVESTGTLGNKIDTKLIVLSVLFLITSIFVYWRTEPSEAQKKPPLKQYFEHVDGYETLRHIAMADNAVKMLDLDDYVFVEYKGESGILNLYIGYYYTAGKAYASGRLHRSVA